MELKYVGEKTARKTKKEIRRAGFAATRMFAQRMSAGNMLAFLESGDSDLTWLMFLNAPAQSLQLLPPLAITQLTATTRAIRVIASTSGINTVNSNNKSNQSIATTTICNSLKSKPLGNPKETPPDHAKVIDLHSSPEPPKTSTMRLEPEDLDFKFQGGMILNEVVSCTETFGPSVDDLGSEHSTPRFIIGYHCF
ncbi:unnamed protein product [Timema podura]|uniref:Uncharacterized protein n=1 Tax=Timema podura TaxID=61482 RepID=A0ABN7NSE5_TIMPD|nr:unnamed protein product [Timema podura]